MLQLNSFSIRDGTVHRRSLLKHHYQHPAEESSASPTAARSKFQSPCGPSAQPTTSTLHGPNWTRTDEVQFAGRHCGESNNASYLVCLGQGSPSTSLNSHNDLLRTDSGNSSLSTADSLSSTSSDSHGSSFHSTSLDPNFSEDCSGFEEEEDLIRVNVYIPETQREYDIACSRRQSIWQLKTILIERNQGLRENGLNYGIFCFPYGQFLDEQLRLADYFPHCDGTESKPSLGAAIRLEFLYKQRIKYGEVMSTLPISSATRKKRKRSRLLSAIQNGNLDKVVKALANCDPNFVDESTGETPLSLASSIQPSNSGTLQQIIVAIVNGGALLDFRTKDGRTALHVAVQKSNFVALKTLLDLGGSPNLLDATGLTPLFYSIIHQANPKVTQLLLHEHATLGITDQHGWQEVHHASKLGLAVHLEQLLFYGCDMNCRIVGSGNTPLHVAAINDQSECARILLLRGCDTSVVNNSHQNAHQVAVISGNMSLAELIINHKPENIVPYRDKPRFNPARRPQNHYGETTLGRGGKASEINGANSALHPPRANSPSLSLNTNNTTASSGVCCDDPEEEAARRRTQGANGDNRDDDDMEGYDDEEEEDEDDGDAKVESSDSEDSATFLPGMTVKAVSDYNSGDPTHLQLRRNDHVLLLQSTHSPPTIASQKLLLGRRCADNQEGFFPACCVEKIKKHHAHNGDENGLGERVEGRRDMKLKSVQSATLPMRGRRGARKCLLDKGVTRQYQERTVTLHRGQNGFGFVLRGAKDSSPILNRQLQGPSGTQTTLIGLQYFDEIEAAGVADTAGIKRGDYLLAVNDVDVRHMSHENAVQLIRQSGDKVTMTIATQVPKQLVSILKKKGRSSSNKQQSANSELVDISANCTSEMLSSSQSQTQMSQSAYASFKANKAPPAPPKRDPSTTLSTSRARARSLVVPSEVRSAHNQTIMLISDSGGDGHSEVKRGETEDEVKCSSPSSVESMARHQGPSPCQNGSKVASIRAHSSRRISSYELNDFMSRQSHDAKAAKTNGVADSDAQAAVASSAKREVHKSDSMDSSSSFPPPPPQSAYQTSIVKVTLAKPQQSDFAGSESAAGEANRALSSFQPARSVQDHEASKAAEEVPPIPEPDYSSDEDNNNEAKSEKKSSAGKQENGECKPANNSTSSDTPGHPSVKLTTTATVVLKSSSPCPPADSSKVTASGESNRNIAFSSKNMFEELREQSAKITSSARLRFASNRQNSTDEVESRLGKMRQGSQDESSQPVNNVMKNVAEFEKRVSGKDQIARMVANGGTNGATSLSDPNSNQMRMSKSCIEELVPNSALLKKGEFATLTRATLRQHQQQQHPDSRRNSAIISAMAEKVAAVNQLVAEQQSISGTKSLNSSPIPSSMGKLPGQPVSGSTVVVQKPIAVLPSGSGAGPSSTLTRRCVTVCEDPVKTIHLQQQHQQLRSQLASTGNAQLVKSKHTSLAESTSSILKQTGKTLRSTTPATVQVAYSPSTEPIDLVPPPPEFAASTPNAQATTATGQSMQSANYRHSLSAQQKVYLQRQLQQQMSTSPLTVATGAGQTATSTHHHHHHHQLVSEVPQHYQQPAQATGQASHYHTHHHGPTATVSLSSSAPTSGDALALMRSSMMATSSQVPLSNYDYGQQQNQQMSSQAKAIQAQHHHGSQGHIYSQQQHSGGQLSSQQQQHQQQSQLLLQQRALAVANAKLLQQQQQQQVRPQSSMAHYNTLATSKPMAVQQYYLAQHPSQQGQHPQYLAATLSRHQQQQYLTSLSSQQQHLQSQQFATLTRQHQQLLQPALQQSLNYAQLAQRGQPMTSMAIPGGRLVQVPASHQTTRQTPPPASAKVQQSQAGYHVGQYTGTAASNAGAASYARKSLVEWTVDDVQEWLQRIGMAEHRPKFECFNGAKMLRLDNNALASIGVRQQQHRIYLLEKLKQQIWQSHQMATNS